MRINKYLAQATGVSRRAADALIAKNHVHVNGLAPTAGMQVDETDNVTLDGTKLTFPQSSTSVMLNKPIGYVCSRNGQGSPTIYELLPEEYYHLKPAGRLDKDSSGLIIVTDDGDLAQQLTHPSLGKTKIYDIVLDTSLASVDESAISNHQVNLEDGVSGFEVAPLDKVGTRWQVTMHEGRNRQIRRTFSALGYAVQHLHRLSIGDFELGSLRSGSFLLIDNNKHSKKS